MLNLVACFFHNVRSPKKMFFCAQQTCKYKCVCINITILCIYNYIYIYYIYIYIYIHVMPFVNKTLACISQKLELQYTPLRCSENAALLDLAPDRLLI